MSTNKCARQLLENEYGKGCMFKKADIEKKVAELKTIKTYKKFLQETRYTGKKIKQLERNMTYHHLKHQSEGGKATIENGSIVNELAHRYLHSLSREQEEIINNMLRKHKMQIAGGIIQTSDNEISMQMPFLIDIETEKELYNENNCIVIPAYDTKQEKVKYNRAEFKKETKKFIDDYIR
jgi:CRISPR/Cas system CSM-associated protein Csm4 (group 5 of RAMP superfamily)